MAKVIISADATCDIGPILQARHNIQLINAKLELEGKEYIDGVEIFPDDLYKAWKERKALPKSSAISPIAYKKHFTSLLKQGDEIVHITLGSGIASSYQNCCLEAKELGNVYPVDSQNVSAGCGQLVIQAALMAEGGMAAPEIQKTIQGMCHRSKASFLLDTLEFMKAGGRCNTLTALGANLLGIKPCIEVDNQDGSRMHVGKKYRGQMEHCLRQYVRDKLEGRDDIDLERAFITHSGSPESDIQAVMEEIARHQKFKEVHVTRASCIISCHCGPRTLGVLFLTKQ